MRKIIKSVKVKNIDGKLYVGNVRVNVTHQPALSLIMGRGNGSRTTIKGDFVEYAKD